MKKIIAFLTAMTTIVSPAAAHAGLYHSYTGTRVSLLILLLWVSLAVYEELGDTFKGHWVLFSGVFLAFYVPLFYPHHPVTDNPVGLLVAATAILVIGAATFLRHRSSTSIHHSA